MLSGLLLLLLELPIAWGQTVEGTLLGSEDNITAQPHIGFNFTANAANGTFLLNEAGHNVTLEDQESFQNQRNIYQFRHCNETFLMMNADMCWNTFHEQMMALGEENWCEWKKVIGHYNLLTLCLEISSAVSSCYFPGPMIQRLFVDIHGQYFSSCSTGDKDFPNTPLSVVLTLTILPVSIIPIAVYMAIWKNNVKV